jgi:murein peptide amidase A
MIHRKNDFEIICSRLRKSSPGSTSLVEYYELPTPEKTYSLIKIITGKGNGRRALISAGIHGDEPSGVEGICSFLEKTQYKLFTSEWELTFLPCLNPYGYEYEIRENHEGKDLNRLFKNDSPPQEVMFAMSTFDNCYDLTIELHEDNTSPGYYLYQTGTHAEDEILGSKILQSVKSTMPINLSQDIDGHKANKGVINPENNLDSMDWWPMALYSLSKGTRKCLVLETSTHFPIEKRVEAQLIAINTALEYFSN